MTLERVMVVVRLAGGKLLIHNGIALDENSMAEIERFGTPAYLIVPSGGHRLDAPAYKKRYPGLKVFAPRGARAKVAEVCRAFAGRRERRAERLHVQHGSQKDLLGYLFTTVFGSAPGPRVSRLAKLALIKDKPALRADFERLAELPNLTRVIVAHENIAAGPAARVSLLEAATYL
ncbi:MAG TPA: hypothetical protein VHV51_09045 [Polyangiaceae bacterium]|jgi:hypothetical protein|nr:hypothetical protein [Polyangiaceae bacterium]